MRAHDFRFWKLFVSVVLRKAANEPNNEHQFCCSFFIPFEGLGLFIYLFIAASYALSFFHIYKIRCYNFL